MVSVCRNSAAITTRVSILLCAFVAVADLFWHEHDRPTVPTQEYCWNPGIFCNGIADWQRTEFFYDPHLCCRPRWKDFWFVRRLVYRRGWSTMISDHTHAERGILIVLRGSWTRHLGGKRQECTLWPKPDLFTFWKQFAWFLLIKNQRNWPHLSIFPFTCWIFGQFWFRNWGVLNKTKQPQFRVTLHNDDEKEAHQVLQNLHISSVEIFPSLAETN